MTDDPITKLLEWPHTTDDDVLLNSKLCVITVGDVRRLQQQRDEARIAHQSLLAGTDPHYGATEATRDGRIQRARDTRDKWMNEASPVGCVSDKAKDGQDD